MKKILFLTHMLPYPPHGGGAIKRWKLVEFLSKTCELSIGCFTSDENQLAESEFLSKIRCRHYHSESLDIRRNFLNLLRSYLNQVPLSVYRNQSSKMKNHVHAIARDHDLIFLDSLLMFQYIPADYAGRIILHAHNAEYSIWEKYAGLENNPLKKMLIKIESQRMRKYELKACRKSHFILAAPNDEQALLNIGADESRIHRTCHLGDEELLSRRNIEFDETGNALMFAGSLGWLPNSDGLKWFISNIWRRIQEKNPQLKLYIIGQQADEELKRLAAHETNIELTGFVEDLEEYYSSSRLFIAPLRFGAGIKVKIINAMYRGIPVVTTHAGAEGLEIRPQVHACVADEPAELVSQILELLEDKDRWTRYRDCSRLLMRQKYTWDKVFSELEKVIDLC